MQGPILVIPPVTRGGTDRKLTGPSARRGIWVKKPEEVYPGLAVLRERQAKTVSMTYTTVVNVPILRYATATPAAIQEKRKRIKEEKRDSADNMEKRISRFCQAYRLSIPETNSHSTIKKDAPWLTTSRADGTEHSHVINAAVPKVENGINQNDNDTIPLDLKQCHIFYSDTGIASWRLAMSKDGEIARLIPVKRNSSFREYTWRLSYLVCQGKRQMRLMARSKQERCGPLPLFSQHSLVRQLEFDMPEGNEYYKQEGIPISRAVRILFQTADMEAFEKEMDHKKRMFNKKPKSSVGVVPKKKGVVPKKEDKLEVEAHPVGLKLSKSCLCLPEQHDQEEKDASSLEGSDDSANNDSIKSPEPTQSQLLEDLNREPEIQMQTPDPVNLPTPTPTPPVTPTPSPEGKAKKGICKPGCCAFL